MLAGAGCVPRAFALLRRSPHLWRYVTVPILINLVVGVVAYSALLVGGLRAVDALSPDSSGLAAAAETVLQALVVIAALLVVAFVVIRFGVVLGSPWYGRLSELVERDLTGTSPPAQPLTPAGIARDLRRALVFEGAKLLLVVCVGLPLLLANLLPVAGQVVSAVGGAALAATIACLDFLDGPLERRRRSFRDKVRYARTTLPDSGGFGLVCVALLTLPLLNLVSIPLCVVAGTLFYSERPLVLGPAAEAHAR